MQYRTTLQIKNPLHSKQFSHKQFKINSHIQRHFQRRNLPLNRYTQESLAVGTVPATNLFATGRTARTQRRIPRHECARGAFHSHKFHGGQHESRNDIANDSAFISPKGQADLMEYTGLETNFHLLLCVCVSYARGAGENTHVEGSCRTCTALARHNRYKKEKDGNIDRAKDRNTDEG